MDPELWDYIFWGLGLFAVLGVIWFPVAIVWLIRSIKPYKGTIQADMFEKW